MYLSVQIKRVGQVAGCDFLYLVFNLHNGLQKPAFNNRKVII